VVCAAAFGTLIFAGAAGKLIQEFRKLRALLPGEEYLVPTLEGGSTGSTALPISVRQDKTKALDMFNKGEGGFKDRDLYVFCANASDSILTAHPTRKGEKLTDIKDVKGFAFGEEMMRATEGKISEITYMWPKPGSEEPVQKRTYYTKIGDQICAVGSYAPND
jgi:hypothetical protein